MSLTDAFNGWKLGQATLDAKGTGGETCLTRALKMQSYEVAADFLKLGASPDAVNAAGEKPLAIAIALKDRELIELLLDKRASVLADAPGGLNMAQYAKLHGMPDVAVRLAQMIREKEASAYAWPGGPYC